jgi:hypothetical protein
VRVDAYQVLRWLGDDATMDDVAHILADIANGEYKPKDLKQEISDYNDE